MAAHPAVTPRVWRWAGRAVWAAGVAAVVYTLSTRWVLVALHTGVAPAGPLAWAAGAAALAGLSLWGAGRHPVWGVAPWGVAVWSATATGFVDLGGLYLVNEAFYREGCHTVMADLARWAEAHNRWGVYTIPHDWVVERVLHPVGTIPDWLASHRNPRPDIPWGGALNPERPTTNVDPSGWRLIVYQNLPVHHTHMLDYYFSEYRRFPTIVTPPRGGNL